MEPPYCFIDAHGRAWDVYDFRIVNGKRERVPINDQSAEQNSNKTGVIMKPYQGKVAKPETYRPDLSFHVFIHAMVSPNWILGDRRWRA